jgi:ribosomal protein L3 glutamine methyltransferase
VMGLDFNGPDTARYQEVTQNQLDTVVALALRRINDRIPLPYLTGEAWFAGLRFHVDTRALIPRSPFAELIQNEFAPWLSIKRDMKILDMCTGNGCIGIATAVYLPEARVDLVDVSAAALELCRKNIELYDVGGRIEVIQSDLFDVLEGRRYDLIVSNPPYVPASSMAELPIEYRHEPGIALQAEDEGLAIVDRILQQADDYLSDDGVLIVEVGEIADMVHQHYQALPFIWLEFEHGGEGVFLLYKQDLTVWHNGKSKNS